MTFFQILRIIFLLFKKIRNAAEGVASILFQESENEIAWPLLPDELKNASSLQVFKWKPTNYSCRLCKAIQNVALCKSHLLFFSVFFFESNEELQKLQRLIKKLQLKVQFRNR